MFERTQLDGERERYCVNFSDRLADGEKVTSQTVVVTDTSDDSDVTSTILETGSARIEDDIKVTAVVKGLQPGVEYKMVFAGFTDASPSHTLKDFQYIRLVED